MANDKLSLVATMANKYGMEETAFLPTLKETIFPNKGREVTNAQAAAFLVVAKEYDINPFTREICAFPSKGGGITPIVPIDGWTKLSMKNKGYRGCKFIPEFEPDSRKIVSYTCQIMVQPDNGNVYMVEVTEYLDECKRNTEPWNKMPKRMLRHKAFIQCARMAFGLSGIYDPDEGEQIVKMEISSTPEARTESATQTKTDELKDRLGKNKDAEDAHFDDVLKGDIKEAVAEHEKKADIAQEEEINDEVVEPEKEVLTPVEELEKTIKETEQRQDENPESNVGEVTGKPIPDKPVPEAKEEPELELIGASKYVSLVGDFMNEIAGLGGNPRAILKNHTAKISVSSDISNATKHDVLNAMQAEVDKLKEK